jgi:hypothetical protein
MEQSCSQEADTQLFMELEGSLPCSKEPTAHPSPEPHESSLYITSYAF